MGKQMAFLVPISRENTNDLNILIDLLATYTDWSNEIPGSSASLALINHRLKPFGVAIVTVRQKSNKVRIRSIRFRSESDYTLFKLKYS